MKEAKLHRLPMAFERRTELQRYAYHCYPGLGVTAQLIQVSRQKQGYSLSGTEVPQIFLTCRGKVKDVRSFFSDVAVERVEQWGIPWPKVHKFSDYSFAPLFRLVGQWFWWDVHQYQKRLLKIPGNGIACAKERRWAW